MLRCRGLDKINWESTIDLILRVDIIIRDIIVLDDWVIQPQHIHCTGQIALGLSDFLSGGQGKIPSRRAYIAYRLPVFDQLECVYQATIHFETVHQTLLEVAPW